MLAYIVRRLLLIVPTLFGIMVINFAVIQTAPGGPVEQLIQQLTQGGAGADVTARVSGAGTGDVARGSDSRARAGDGSESAAARRTRRWNERKRIRRAARSAH